MQHENIDNEIAEQLAKLKTYAVADHLPDFYDAPYDPELEALLRERFRTLVECVRRLLDPLSPDELTDELAANNIGNLKSFRLYLIAEINTLRMIHGLVCEADWIHDLFCEGDRIREEALRPHGPEGSDEIPE